MAAHLGSLGILRAGWPHKAAGLLQAITPTFIQAWKANCDLDLFLDQAEGLHVVYNRDIKVAPLLVPDSKASFLGASLKPWLGKVRSNAVAVTSAASHRLQIYQLPNWRDCPGPAPCPCLRITQILVPSPSPRFSHGSQRTVLEFPFRGLALGLGSAAAAFLLEAVAPQNDGCCRLCFSIGTFLRLRFIH